MPHREKFGHYLSKHSHNLARVRHSPWNSGIEMADWYKKIFRCGLAEDAWDHPEIDIKRFQAIEAKLDEIRNYLYANGKAVAGYARAFHRGERVGTAHAGISRQPANQLAFLQKAANGMDQSRSAGPPPRQNRSAEWRFASLHATHQACRSSRLTPSFFMVPVAGVKPVPWYRSAELRSRQSIGGERARSDPEISE